MITKTFTLLLAAILFAASCSDRQELLIATTTSSTETPLTEVDLSEFKQRISYIFGVNIGRQLKRDNMELDNDAFVMALRDVQENKTLRLTPEEVQAAMQQFQQTQRQQQEDTVKVIAEANRKEGKAYMEENAGKAGVITTASGLQYKPLVMGDGPKPTASDNVTVNYRGALLDGTVFDSSYDRGEPVSFPLSGVIPGWTEALQLMPVGSKWELVIPSDLAYGPGGTGREIGPNATLKFEVELLRIN